MYSKKIFIVLLALSLSVSIFGSAMAFPEKGRRITMLVGSGAGGSADLFYRLVAKGLEKELGTNVEVINKAGAGTMFALQALSTSKADGYTIGQASLPTAIMIYLDPQKKAQFDGSNFIPVSMSTFDPGATAVKADSPYKTMKDLVEAVKANPRKIKIGAGAKATRQHLDVMNLEQVIGGSFLRVHADSDANPVTMLVGGHLDVVQESIGDFLNLVKSGQLRILGVWDKKRSPMAPDVPTMEEQGYKLYSGVSRGIALPAGAPKEAVTALDAAIKKVMDSAEFKDGMEKLKQPIRYMDHEEYTQYWKDMEATIKPLMSLVQ
ncbi:MAG: tripartite tricarboxylate transporter substrate binding protein [Thermodesulfobacteriota bacterium]